MLLCLRFGPDLTSKQEVVVPGLGNDEHNRQRFSIHDPDMAFEWPTTTTSLSRHRLPHQYNGIFSIKGKCPSITSISSLDMSQSFDQKYNNELDTPPSHPPSTLLTRHHGTSINTTENFTKDMTRGGKNRHRHGLDMGAS
jgi:hypothetical protein